MTVVFFFFRVSHDLLLFCFFVFFFLAHFNLTEHDLLVFLFIAYGAVMLPMLSCDHHRANNEQPSIPIALSNVDKLPCRVRFCFNNLPYMGGQVCDIP